MLKILLCFIILYVTVFGKEDFFKFDYCKLNCKDEQHSSCYCKRKPEPPDPDDDELNLREEVTYELVNFRKKVLELHNYWRNQLAMGLEDKYKKGAEDMMALSYDLELEHCARCFAVVHYKGEHDNCRRTQDKKKFGQNLVNCNFPAFTRTLQGTVKYNLDVDASKMLSWWAEIKNVKHFKVIEKFNTVDQITHWTQWAWSTMNRIGCARAYRPDMQPKAALSYVIVCHYQSKLPSASTTSCGNVIGRPIFKQGKACADCPDDTKCTNKDYEGLCGEILPIPTSNLTEIPFDTPKKTEKPPRSREHKHNEFTLITVFVSVLLTSVFLRRYF